MLSLVKIQLRRRTLQFIVCLHTDPAKQVWHAIARGYYSKYFEAMPEHLSIICNLKAGIEQFLSTYVAFKVAFAELQTTSMLQHHSPWMRLSIAL